MKSQKKNNPDETQNNKNTSDNNLNNSGRPEKEQKRNQETSKASPATKSAEFERDIQNEQQNDVERNTQKRKPIEEDESRLQNTARILDQM